MTALAVHWRRWRFLYVVAAVALLLALAGRWADSKVRTRDAGITWLFAYSPRTLQSYSVRAHVQDGQLLDFHLEHGERYQFSACTLPDPGDRAECRDATGLPWMIEP